jgi:hypothetical protein
MKVLCKNILCKGKPFEIEDTEDLKNVTCPHCGNIGVMPDYHVVGSDEIIRQVTAWKDKVLYRDAFKVINYKKLPANMDQQSIAVPKRQEQQIERHPTKKVVSYKRKI